MSWIDKLLPSLQQRLMVALLAPLLVLCLVLTAYGVSVRHNDLTGRLLEVADTTSRYLADSADFALFAGDKEQLNSLASSVMMTPEITAVTFVDSRFEQVVTVGRSILSGGEIFSQQAPATAQLHDNIWLFHRPVVAVQVMANDFDEGVVSTAVLGSVAVELDNAWLLKRQAESVQGIVVVALVVLLIAVFFAVQISRGISVPLRRLTSSVEQIEAGREDVDIHLNGPRELALLAEVLRRQLAKTRDYSARLERDVEKATVQLLDTMNDLEEAMVAKDQFMAKMSHELRTPLTAVIGFTAALADESLRSKREEYQRIIASSSQLLLKTIDDVLEFARSNSGELTLENGQLNLRDTLSDVLAIHANKAAERNIHLQLNIEEAIPSALWGDAVRIAQVFNNLIGNAIKFTDSGAVTVNVDSSPARADDLQRLVCTVSDSGKGIAQSRIRHLFSPFAQEDDSISRQFGGSGLGLAISRSLVELMGGSISIESSEGEGTTVHFTLQLARHSDAAQASKAPDSALFKGKMILIAEDHPYNQQLLQRIIEQCGAQTIIVDNGAKVLEKIYQHSVDLILLDIHMPVMDGVQTARALSDLDDAPPIIGLTADVSSSEHLAMLSAGAVKVLVKPIDQQALLSSLAGLLDRPEPELMGDGLLSSSEVPEELLETLQRTVQLLRGALQSHDAAKLRGAVHDLMGLSGLYGMNDLRSEVLALRAGMTVFTAEEKQRRIDLMLELIAGRRQHSTAEPTE